MATTADVPVTSNAGGGDQNTNPPVKTLIQTQATNGDTRGINIYTEDGTLSNFRRNPETGDLYNAAGLPGGVDLKTEPGVGANDNNPAPSTVNTQATVNATSPTNETIKPQPNVLDKFSSYTYQASVYLMSNAQYAAYQLSEKKTINGYNLLFQTGGAPNNIGGPQGPAAPSLQTFFENDGTSSSTPAAPQSPAFEAGRNPFFPYDYYIDSVKVTNKLLGKNTMAAHSVTDLKFTVIEPANITLIDNIYKAVQDIAPKGAAGAVNYAAAIYLMVIRFFGYDANGNLQTVGVADPVTGLSDSSSLIEKYIPFRIKNINWAVANKLVSYDFECAPIGQLIAGGTKRGTIPGDMELTGASVSDMLKGQAVYGEPPAAATPGATTTADRTQTDGRGRRSASSDSRVPPKATAAPNNKKTIQRGLIEAMNSEQQRLVSINQYTVADVYELEFANGAELIQDATVQKPGTPVNKSATAVSAPVTSDTSAASPDKGAMDTKTRSFGITAGMQILQAIELTVRNSSYITDQANLILNEESGNPEVKPGSETQDFKWFNILMSATPLEYDEKRNDFAYRVKFIIVPYSPAEMKSSYFPGVKFPGLVKRYPWWFTGENTAVLSYTATFNKLYIQTLTGSSPENSALASIRKTQATSMREIPFISYQSRSTESSQGAGGKANELGASAAEYLYNPSDNASAKIKILGDPAWIQQGSVAGALDASKISYSPFARDGTINFDIRDVLFELVWQRPEDYNLNTGLADPYSRTEKIYGDRQPIQSIVYRAKEIVSSFNQGRFEQDIDATIYSVPIPQKTNTATPVATPAAGDESYGGATTAEQDAINQALTRSGPGGSGAAKTAAATVRKTTATGPKNAPIPRGSPGVASDSFAQAELARFSNYTPTPFNPSEPVVSNGQVVGANTNQGAAIIFRNANPRGTQRGARET